MTLTFIDRKEATERMSPKMSLSNVAARSWKVRISEDKREISNLERRATLSQEREARSVMV